MSTEIMSHQLKVIISSTARDLPEHRKEVMDACLRQGMFPDMMEHLPASDEHVEEYKVNDYHALLDVIQSEINQDLTPFHIARAVLVRPVSGISWRGAYHGHQISYGNKLFCPNADFLSALHSAKRFIARYLPTSYLHQIGFTIP